MSITTSGGLTVTNIQSKAGFATSIHVKGIGKQCDIMFDCGVLDEEMLSAKHIFISHGHIDHIGACVSHARARSLRGNAATYYVPEHCVDALIGVRTAFEALEGKEIPMNILPIGLTTPPIEITPYYSVAAFPTVHRVPSQGYRVIHKKVGGLLPQYKDCSREELAQLRKQNTQLTEIAHTTELVYTGDTTFDGLMLPELDFIREAELLLIEMTYLDGDTAKAEKYGHIHLDDFVAACDQFQNRQIIFVHLSAKYYPPMRALAMLQNTVPPHIAERCAVGLKSFGFREAVTPLVTTPSSTASTLPPSASTSGGGYKRRGDGSGRGKDY